MARARIFFALTKEKRGSLPWERGIILFFVVVFFSAKTTGVLARAKTRVLRRKPPVFRSPRGGFRSFVGAARSFLPPEELVVTCTIKTRPRRAFGKRPPAPRKSKENQADHSSERAVEGQYLPSHVPKLMAWVKNGRAVEGARVLFRLSQKRPNGKLRAHRHSCPLTKTSSSSLRTSSPYHVKSALMALNTGE